MNFPRSPERGPVEAMLWPVVMWLLTGFPRSPERGPVEAGFIPRRAAMLRMAFRAHPSAAPLKPYVHIVGVCST